MACRISKLILIFLLTTNFLLYCSNGEITQKKEIFSNLKLPVYPYAKNVKIDFYEKYLTNSVEYDLEEYYPAKKIINFYDNIMRKKLYKQYPKEYVREIGKYWVTYSDGTKKDKPKITGFKRSWVNEDKTVRATLILRYFWYKKERIRILTNNKDLKVWFRMQPFFTDPEDEFIREEETR